MNTDERLICESAQALIGTIPGVQIALMGDDEGLDLPLLVLSARLKEEQEGSSLADEYALDVALRWIFDAEPPGGADALLEQIAATLSPRGETAIAAPPSVITSNFDYFRIEKQTGSDFKQAGGDLGTRTRERSRVFLVFAKLS